MDLRRPATVEAALAPTPCLVYVRTSLCSTTEGRPACDEIEGRLVLLPIARAAFTGSRDVETFSHDRDTVETVVSRVERVAGRAADAPQSISAIQQPIASTRRVPCSASAA